MEHIWTLSQMQTGDTSSPSLVGDGRGRLLTEVGDGRYTPKGDYTENYPNSFWEIGDKDPSFPRLPTKLLL